MAAIPRGDDNHQTIGLFYECNVAVKGSIAFCQEMH